MAKDQRNVEAITPMEEVLLRRSFIRIATATGQSAKRAYRERAAMRRSVSSALLSKELCRPTGTALFLFFW